MHGTPDDMEPLIPKSRFKLLVSLANNGDSVPLHRIFREETGSCSDKTAYVLKKIGEGDNVEHILGTIFGYPQAIDHTEDFNREQMEAQLVEFIRFYGVRVCDYSRETLIDCAVEVIQNTPIAELAPGRWNTETGAIERTTELFDFLEEEHPLEPEPSESQKSDRDSSSTRNTTTRNPTPQDVSDVEVPKRGMESDWDKRSKDAMSDLL